MTTSRSTANREAAANREAGGDPAREPSRSGQALRGGSVYLRHPPREAQAEPLSWLVRLLRLEVYSDRLLTRRVRTELSILAVILLLVFFYEFAAWSFFFNGLFLGDVTRFDPRWTIAALLFGLLFSGVILYFERQVITTDVQRLAPSQRRLAQGIRLGAIVLGAVIVAHAVELLVFAEPVERALYSRAVARTTESLERDLDGVAGITEEHRRADLVEDLAGIHSRIGDTERRREEAAGDIARAREQVSFWEGEVRRERAVLAAAERRLTEQEDGGGQATLQARRNDVESARRRYEDARAHHREAAVALQAVHATLQETYRSLHDLGVDEKAVRERRWSLSEETGARQRAIETLRSRLRSWEEALFARTERGDHTEDWPGLKSASAEEMLLWPERWRRTLEFEEPDWTFFERIAKVYELAWGSQRSENEPAESAWLPTIYRSAFVVVHLTAIFVPLLVFTVKWFLIPKEVDAYYSAWHQAYAGDPDARLALNVEEKVRRNGARW